MNPYSDLRIYIPTYRRGGMVRTLKYMSPEALKNTALVIRPEEAQSYLQAAVEFGCALVALPNEIKNLSQTRQWILDDCEKNYCMMLDDDLDFSYRLKSGDWHTKYLGPDTLHKFDEMVTDMLNKMKTEGIAHCAVAAREGSNTTLEDWAYNQRYMRAYIFDTKVVGKFKYSEEHCGCEDFHMALQLITAGYPSAIYFMYPQGQGGSNKKGGLSAYRDIEYHNNAMAKLKESFPNYVRLVQKKTKTAWGGQQRTDAVISWAKAFASVKIAPVAPEPIKEPAKDLFYND